ncbi:Ferric uptake regulation protein [Paraburkholderia tropica]|nr:Ferric uptake regulation protein [Paraburkholderia tropica]
MNEMGVRVTPTRIGVLTTMFEIERGVKADEIYKFAIRKKIGLSKASIYRALVDFESAGIVSRQWVSGNTGARATFFLQCPYEAEKMHVVSCRKCGCRVRFKNPDLFDTIKAAAQSEIFGSRDKPISIVIVCADCE